ncbi:MAG: HAD hydrolase family protein [Armatimonadetes bacterium]|nr:HAD hydrolase family protein [Armatimonadota bacterium]MDE2205452.1 HAD hydrolase family protein [Armatimonadota bacterium]
MDVDGVLTDGGIMLSGAGTETKRFFVRDGLGLVLLRRIGIRSAWITGRTSASVEQRAHELCIDDLCQDVRDKAACLAGLAEANGVPRHFVAFIGDDLNDLPAFDSAGLNIAVADAAEDLRAAADFVTRAPGGRGAVREVCEEILNARGDRTTAIRAYLEWLRASTPGEHPAPAG